MKAYIKYDKDKELNCTLKNFHETTFYTFLKCRFGLTPSIYLEKGEKTIQSF